MRLVGFSDRGERWIGSVRGGRLQPLAPVDDFYAAGGDVPRGRRAGGPGRGRAGPAGAGDRPGLLRRDQLPRARRGGQADHRAGRAGDPDGLRPVAEHAGGGRRAGAGPPAEAGLDWEVELAVVIGRRGWAVPAAEALDHVLGYTAFNDLSARAKQLQTSQWTLGKNADRSGPIGPVVVTRDEIPDPSGLRLEARVNGEVMQRADTSQLIHGSRRLIEYISDTVTLRPGDVIATGTPGGVGLGRTPPRYLVPGDVVEVEVERIGTAADADRAAGRPASGAAVVTAGDCLALLAEQRMLPPEPGGDLPVRHRRPGVPGGGDGGGPGPGPRSRAWSARMPAAPGGGPARAGPGYRGDRRWDVDFWTDDEVDRLLRRGVLAGAGVRPVRRDGAAPVRAGVRAAARLRPGGGGPGLGPPPAGRTSPAPRSARWSPPSC